MMRNYLAELAARHNNFVADTTKEFYITATKFQTVSKWSIGTDQKLSVTEQTFMAHDQRIASNDVWLKSVCKDMTDQLTKMFKQAEGLALQVKADVSGLEDRLHDMDGAVRTTVIDCLNAELSPRLMEMAQATSVRTNVLDCLNAELAPRLLEMAQESAEVCQAQTGSRLVKLEINSEGVTSDLKALGMAVDGLRVEGQQVAQQVLASGGGATLCPCATGNCPCKCSNLGADVQAKGEDPWQVYYTGGELQSRLNR